MNITKTSAMAKLRHPGIVPVHDAGETADGLLYFVMDFVEGTDVQKMIAARGRLPPGEVLSIVARVLDALACAHQHGIIHRDIKPANIMVDPEGHVLVADFGLARSTGPDTTLLTGSHIAMGTPDFMAPEARSDTAHVDHRADLFAVGVMLYQMLTGRLPHGRFEPPSRAVPGLDRRLDSIVDKILQPDRDKRYSSAIEVKAALEPILAKAAKHAGGTRRSVARFFCESGRSARGATRSTLAIAAVVAITAAGSFFAWKKAGKWPAQSSVRKDGAEPSNSAAQGTVRTTSAAFSSSPAAATKEAPFVNTLGMKFVPVPITGPARNASRSDAGGGPTDGQRVLFCIWETRVQDYEVFAKDHHGSWSKPPFAQGPAHPATRMRWEDAQAFCVWLTARERKEGRLGANERYRLPSDHEWSCAVGIGGREDPALLPSEKDEKLADVFPWGSVWPPPAGAGNFSGEETVGHEIYKETQKPLPGYRDDFIATAPVGSFPPDRHGLHDLSGNVWEWCEDWYDASQTQRVVRGGAWANDIRGKLLSSARSYYPPGSSYHNRGFRCVLVVK